MEIVEHIEVIEQEAQKIDNDGHVEEPDELAALWELTAAVTNLKKVFNRYNGN